jgi:hypothetical protein
LSLLAISGSFFSDPFNLPSLSFHSKESRNEIREEDSSKIKETKCEKGRKKSKKRRLEGSDKSRAK